MSTYKRILLAVDLSEDSDTVCRRAVSLAAAHQAQILLLHVVEYIPVEPMGEALLPTVHVEEELQQSADERLERLAARYGLQDSPRWVKVGNIKSELVNLAREHSVDLIMLGARERHGLAILLNFTEDSVLHAAPCDVLAVRLPG